MHLNGKDLEELVLWRAREVDIPAKRYTLGRYGVMAVMIAGEWKPIRSLPDFEGVLPSGRQFIFDCKVCSQASFDLTPPGDKSKSFTNQYKHLKSRQAFGVITFLYMHFNLRILKKRMDPELTVLFPVMDNEFWRSYDGGETKGITRTAATAYGIPITWDIPEGKRTLSPDLYTGLLKLIG